MKKKTTKTKQGIGHIFALLFQPPPPSGGLGGAGIFDNGTISFIKQIGGGFQDGNPVEAKTVNSLYYPCHIVVNSDNKKGRYQDGNFQQCSYIIYMDKLIIDVDIVKLTQDGKDLGEFVIQSVEQHKLLNRIKIMV